MPSTPTPWTPNRYPPARRSDHVDVYKSEKNGEVRVPDPYQWLEQNTDETEQWTTAQEQFTRAYLDQNPERQALEDQIRTNMDYAKVCTRICAYDASAYQRAFTDRARPPIVLRPIAQGRWSLVLVLQHRSPGSVRSVSPIRIGQENVGGRTVSLGTSQCVPATHWRVLVPGGRPSP